MRKHGLGRSGFVFYEDVEEGTTYTKDFKRNYVLDD